MLRHSHLPCVLAQGGVRGRHQRGRNVKQFVRLSLDDLHERGEGEDGEGLLDLSRQLVDTEHEEGHEEEHGDHHEAAVVVEGEGGGQKPYHEGAGAVASVAERNGCAQQPLAATCDAAQLVQHLLDFRVRGVAETRDYVVQDRRHVAKHHERLVTLLEHECGLSRRKHTAHVLARIVTVSGGVVGGASAGATGAQVRLEYHRPHLDIVFGFGAVLDRDAHRHEH
mmetsp:Transcript_16657/g.29718  ORF Transcript_16657/g.29718 Transcript_16657/m.29718 type:complete len:224 (+) Transcript_16657:344-1015(+)